MKARLTQSAIAVILFVIPGALLGQSWSAGSGGALYYNGGNVGVGTGSPNQPLDVAKSATPGDTTTARQIRIGVDSNPNYSFTLGYFESNTGQPFEGVLQARDGGNGTYLSLNPSGGYVGIGTTSPSSPLTVSSNGPNALGITGSSTNSVGLFMTNSIGGGGSFSVFSSGGGPSPAGSFGVYDNNAAATRLVLLSNGYVGINTQNPQHQLGVNGSIGATEVVVSSSGADYVFQPDYQLASLHDVADYIKTNKHLPGIPSASELQEKGVNLGDMQTKLLAKIEELTLHMIELQRRNQELEDRVARLGGNK